MEIGEHSIFPTFTVYFLFHTQLSILTELKKPYISCDLLTDKLFSLVINHTNRCSSSGVHRVLKYLKSNHDQGLFLATDSNICLNVFAHIYIYIFWKKKKDKKKKGKKKVGLFF